MEKTRRTLFGISLLVAQLCWFARSQSVGFSAEDFSTEGILYVTPQGYISASQPQIIGYQIVPSDGYTGQRALSLDSSDILGVYQGQQAGFGQTAQTLQTRSTGYRPNSHQQYVPQVQQSVNAYQSLVPSSSYRQYETGSSRPSNQDSLKPFRNIYHTPYSTATSNRPSSYQRRPSTSEDERQGEYSPRRRGSPLNGERSSKYNNRRFRNNRQSSGNSRVPVYVPVSLQEKRKKTKKVKTITVSRGFYIAGGNQLYGKFKTLKSCQRACDRTPNCFAGDFDRTTYRCYIHDSETACDPLSPHRILMHFKKVPCSVAELGITNGQLMLGSNLFNGLLQKGVKDIQTCIKKCLRSGGGIASSHAAAATTPQLCFGIDYDFATHKCFHHTSATVTYTNTTTTLNTVVTVLRGIPGGVTCHDGTVSATGLTQNSNVVNILVCPQ